jgi:hypothetical protein
MIAEVVKCKHCDSVKEKVLGMDGFFWGKDNGFRILDSQH